MNVVGYLGKRNGFPFCIRQCNPWDGSTYFQAAQGAIPSVSSDKYIPVTGDGTANPGTGISLPELAELWWRVRTMEGEVHFNGTVGKGDIDNDIDGPDGGPGSNPVEAEDVSIEFQGEGHNITHGGTDEKCLYVQTRGVSALFDYIGQKASYPTVTPITVGASIPYFFKPTYGDSYGGFWCIKNSGLYYPKFLFQGNGTEYGSFRGAPGAYLPLTYSVVIGSQRWQAQDTHWTNVNEGLLDDEGNPLPPQWAPSKIIDLGNIGSINFPFGDIQMFGAIFCGAAIAGGFGDTAPDDSIDFSAADRLSVSGVTGSFAYTKFWGRNGIWNETTGALN